MTNLPTLSDFRRAGIKLPVVGTESFNIFYKKFYSSLDISLKVKYTRHQVKKFLVKASHSYHGDGKMGRDTRGYYHRVKPAKHHREMGKKRIRSDTHLPSGYKF